MADKGRNRYSTTVYLDASQTAALDLLYQRTDVPRSVYIRRAIDEMTVERWQKSWIVCWVDIGFTIRILNTRSQPSRLQRAYRSALAAVEAARQGSSQEAYVQVDDLLEKGAEADRQSLEAFAARLYREWNDTTVATALISGHMVFVDSHGRSVELRIFDAGSDYRTANAQPLTLEAIRAAARRVYNSAGGQPFAVGVGDIISDAAAWPISGYGTAPGSASYVPTCTTLWTPPHQYAVNARGGFTRCGLRHGHRGECKP